MNTAIISTQPDPPHLDLRAVGSDPAAIGWPSTLPMELALGEASAEEICTEYGLTREDFGRLIRNAHFQKAFASCQEALQKDGFRFRVKAQMQAEALLDTSWKLIHSQYTPAAVKAKLIETTIRAAGLEPKESDRAPLIPLQINISL